jgi:hypothetical protein
MALHADTAYLGGCSMNTSATGPRGAVPVRADVVRQKLASIRAAVTRLPGQLPITVERLEGDGMLR